MKKLISLLLAVIMAFSVCTIAFAEDVTTETPEVTQPAEGEGEGDETTDLGDLQWILDLPFWTVKPAMKFAKIAFKLVSVYLKVAKIFGIVDEDMDDMILGMIQDLIAQNSQEPVPEDTTAPAETTAPAAA